MITNMIEGFAKLVMYILLTPKVLILALFVGLLLIGTAIVPWAVYVYPFWKGTVSNTSIPIQADTLNLNVIVTRPTRLLPDREGHEIILEIENLDTDPVSVTISIDKNQPYVDFQDRNILPIVSVREIPPNARVIESLPFNVKGSIQPRDPTRFTLNIETNSGGLGTSFIIPVDYLSVPVIAVLGALIPAIGLVFKLIWQIIS